MLLRSPFWGVLECKDWLSSSLSCFIETHTDTYIPHLLIKFKMIIEGFLNETLRKASPGIFERRFFPWILVRPPQTLRYIAQENFAVGILREWLKASGVFHVFSTSEKIDIPTIFTPSKEVKKSKGPADNSTATQKWYQKCMLNTCTNTCKIFSILQIPKKKTGCIHCVCMFENAPLEPFFSQLDVCFPPIRYYPWLWSRRRHAWQRYAKLLKTLASSMTMTKSWFKLLH